MDGLLIISITAILHSLYIISPAYCANAFAVFGGGTPIDFGRTWKGKAILGPGKSWRGLVIGVIAGTLFGLLWFYLSQSGPLSETYYGFNFQLTQPYFGFVLGFGALLGDLAGSFIKRRLGKKRGAHVPGLDQLDLLLGALVLGYIFITPFLAWQEVIILIAITIIFHVIGNRIAFLVKKKDVPW